MQSHGWQLKAPSGKKYETTNISIRKCINPCYQKLANGSQPTIYINREDQTLNMTRISLYHQENGEKVARYKYR